MAFLHQSDVWRMGKYFFSMDVMFGNGRAGLYIITKGILWLSVSDLSFLCSAFNLDASRALLMAA